MMKKIFATLLAVCLMFTMFAFADDTEITDSDKTADMEVSLTIDRTGDTYTVVIPSGLTIDPATKSGSATITVKSGYELISSEQLIVYLKAAQNYGSTSSSGMYLSGENDEKHQYYLTVGGYRSLSKYKYFSCFPHGRK